MDTAQYFYRNSIYSKINEKVSIIDFGNPEKNRQELEPWFTTIFLLADGQHTLDELYLNLAQKYSNSPPENLLKTIHSVVERLEGARLIVLTEKKTDLPYYLSMPYEEMDLEKAKKLIAEDAKLYHN
jgi:hypothetical protein